MNNLFISRKNILLFLFYSSIFIGLTFFTKNTFLEPTKTLNFRLLFSSNQINDLSEIFTSKKITQKISTPDDPGFLLAFAFFNSLSNERLDPKNTDADNFPFSFKIFYLIIHLLFIFLFINISDTFLNLPKKIFTLAFLVSPNFLSVYLGYDVYLFPLYSVIISLLLFDKLKNNKLSLSVFSLLVSLSLFCNYFRKGSIYYLLPILLLIIFQKNIKRLKKIIYLASFAILFLTSKMILTPIFNIHGHTVWHSLHAGLFELGGCVDQKGNIFPYFIYEDLSLKNNIDKVCHPGWNDAIEYLVANIHNIKVMYSPEYDQILKKQFLELITNHPFAFLHLISYRIKNILSFMPFKNTSPTGAVNSFSIWNQIESLIFLLIFSLWFIKNKNDSFPYFISSILLIAIAPVLLVHSGHIIYNMPAHFIQISLITMMLKKKLFVRS